MARLDTGLLPGKLQRSSGFGLTIYDARVGYAGDGPGQEIAGLLARVTRGDLERFVGASVIPLLPDVSGRDALERAACRIIEDRPEDTFADSELRRTLLRNLDSGKRDELQHRLSENDLELAALEATPLEPAVLGVLTAFMGLGSVEGAALVKQTARVDAASSFPLFGHQRLVVRRAYACVGDGRGRTLIHMPTGSGKTRTAMHLVSRLLNANEPSLVVWLAASQELLEQAAETFETAWGALGDRRIGLYRFWGDYELDLDEVADGLLIAGLGKLFSASRRQAAPFFRLSARTRLVVMDEAHQAIAPTYRELIDGLAGAGADEAVLGLSATPGRTWNEVERDEELSQFFRGSKVVLEVPGYENPVEYLLDKGYLARPSFRSLTYKPEVEPTPAELERLRRADDVPTELLDKLATDTARNRTILAGVRDLIDGGHRRIILFGASVGHARTLAAALAAQGVAAPVVASDTPKGRRAAILRTFKAGGADPMVLCNFGVLTTGFDAPQTSAAVIARPTKSLVLYSQMVGRATRGPEAGGNKTCEILTIVDPVFPGFGDVADAFFNWEDVWTDDSRS